MPDTTSPAADRLERLADVQECTELVHRLARGLDRCDAALLASVFHPDATDDHGAFRGSAADFVPWALGQLAGMTRSQHVIGQTLVEVAGDVAAGESYFVAYHVIRTGAAETFVIAAGRYLDRFARRDGVWKIAHRHAVYDWSSTAPHADIWNGSDGPSTYGERGDGDASYAHFAAITAVPPQGAAAAVTGEQAR